MAAAVCAALVVWLAAPPLAGAGFEQYFHFIGNDPDEADPGYNEDAQGLANDGDRWYVTQKDSDGECWVWRMLTLHGGGAVKKAMSTIPGLYNSIGDPCCYNYPPASGTWYLLVPMWNGSGQSLVAVFRGNDALDYVGSAALIDPHPQWIAVDPSGMVYTADFGDVSALTVYALDWSQLVYGNVAVTYQSSVALRDATGLPLSLSRIQGGEFSPSGGLLYLNCGMLQEPDGGFGLHVFETASWRRIARSSNGGEPFNYQFNNGGIFDEEPKGLTVWDRSVQGQLHVLLLDNDYPYSENDIYVKHYTSIIYADVNHSGTEDGTFENPFNTIQEALDFYGDCDFWTGAKIGLKAGAYPEALTFGTDKPVQVRAKGSPCTVGITGRFRFPVGAAAISIYSGGAVKLH